jgi:hypothetical protein
MEVRVCFLCHGVGWSFELSLSFAIIGKMKLPHATTIFLPAQKWVGKSGNISEFFAIFVCNFRSVVATSSWSVALRS